MSASFATLPKPPYYAVIFSSLRTDEGDAAYGEAAERMVELAAQQPGYLGVESTRGADGFGITVSYWADEASILAWKRNLEHAATRERGRKEWYAQFELRVAQVERAYGWSQPARGQAHE
ncbi:antibiotic biosynthesis monooxygenase family protein [Lysobacter sp. CA199]|uniref:antibiotic biosynthesis monooxygenase family protein n=1 Tax=Lysobacter sp. CA199 TaxID=3455608 RepID=UPI003F8D5446